jgi:hypothetical protein
MRVEDNWAGWYNSMLWGGGLHKIPDQEQIDENHESYGKRNS